MVLRFSVVEVLVIQMLDRHPPGLCTVDGQRAFMHHKLQNTLVSAVGATTFLNGWSGSFLIKDNFLKLLAPRELAMVIPQNVKRS